LQAKVIRCADAIDIRNSQNPSSVLLVFRTCALKISYRTRSNF